MFQEFGGVVQYRAVQNVVKNLNIQNLLLDFDSLHFLIAIWTQISNSHQMTIINNILQVTFELFSLLGSYAALRWLNTDVSGIPTGPITQFAFDSPFALHIL